jgi:hypothetical protein
VSPLHRQQSFKHRVGEHGVGKKRLWGGVLTRQRPQFNLKLRKTQNCHRSDSKPPLFPVFTKLGRYRLNFGICIPIALSSSSDWRAGARGLGEHLSESLPSLVTVSLSMRPYDAPFLALSFTSAIPFSGRAPLSRERCKSGAGLKSIGGRP